MTEITRTFGALTFGNLIGAACATAVLAIWNLRSIFIATYATLGIALLLLGLIDQLLSVGVILAVVGFGCGVGLAAAAVLITLRFSASKKASMLILTDACFSIAGFLLSWVATTLIYFQFGWAVAYQLVGVICFAIVFASSISDFSNSEQGPGQDSLAIKTWPVNARWLSASLFLYTLGQYSFALAAHRLHRMFITQVRSCPVDWSRNFGSECLRLSFLPVGGFFESGLNDW